MIPMALSADVVNLVMKANLLIPLYLLLGWSSNDLSVNRILSVCLLMKSMEYPRLSRLVLCLSLKERNVSARELVYKYCMLNKNSLEAIEKRRSQVK